jgi:CheY-like chemotaxis protein
LFIEDIVDAADGLKDVLELGGHEVEVGASEPEGLRKARSFRPEVVLCDIGLAGVDGYAVCHAVRADPELRSVYLIALSGYADPEDAESVRAATSPSPWRPPPSRARSTKALGTREPGRASGAALMSVRPPLQHL